MPASEEAYGEGHEATLSHDQAVNDLANEALGRGQFSDQAYPDQTEKGGFTRRQAPANYDDKSPDNVPTDSSEQPGAFS